MSIRLTEKNLKKYKVSEHFTLWEFAYSRQADRITLHPEDPLQSIQIALVKYLCNHLLEVLRTIKNVPLRVNSGIRDEETYRVLKEQGYHPSRTSDHFYLNPFWQFGVGACDFVPVVDYHDVFQVTWEIFIKGKEILKGKYGQIIFYDSPVFIHISNPISLVYKTIPSLYLKQFHQRLPVLVCHKGKYIRLEEYLSVFRLDKR